MHLLERSVVEKNADIAACADELWRIVALQLKIVAEGEAARLRQCLLDNPLCLENRGFVL